MMRQSDNFNTALPIVSLYVFAGYRLMPAIQSIYSSFVALTFVGPAINNLSNDVKKLKSINIDVSKDTFTFEKVNKVKKYSL